VIDTIPPRTLIGMLTPSSNTVLEPAIAAMLAGLPDVTAHFARFPVTEISLSSQALGQFRNAPMVEAARLLADARVGAICWNGTSAGWLGFDADERLCDEISAATGIPACSSVTALNELFRLTGVRRFALVTPYLDTVQERIMRVYAGAGFTCVAERHLNDPGNFPFSEYAEAAIERMVREVAVARPDAITVFCTNFRGAAVAHRLERDVGIPVYDTVAAGLWQSLRLAGADPARITGWGSMFSLGRATAEPVKPATTAGVSP
jgi:maleate isomerase